MRDEDHGEHQRQFHEFRRPDAGRRYQPYHSDRSEHEAGPKTIAKYTADDVNSFMDVFESRIAA